MAAIDLAYFRQGATRVETSSSVLVSSSKYLNDHELRDWVMTHFLRRNGVDLPTPGDALSGLIQSLGRLRDMDEVAKLIEREKTLNPAFETWITERFFSKMTKEDFARFAPGTLGGEYYRYLVDYDFSMNIGGADAKTDLEFVFQRFGQVHDFEHLLVGGQFTALGEILPYFVRLANTYQHFTPPFAHMLSEMYLFGAFRMVMRGGLHYPTAWLTISDLMRRGIAVGLASESIVMMRYEDAFHLPLAEAREALGIRNAHELETVSDNEVYTEVRAPTEEELSRIGRDDLRTVTV